MVLSSRPVRTFFLAASLVLAASLLVLTLAQLGISRQGLDRKTGRDDG